jgi:hypothetical protein
MMRFRSGEVSKFNTIPQRYRRKHVFKRNDHEGRIVGAIEKKETMKERLKIVRLIV